MITVVFGLPGAGKTTYLVRQALKQCKRGEYESVYVNVPLQDYDSLPGTDALRMIDPDWLGKYNIHDCAIHLDESSLLFDSRDYKNFGKDKLTFFMMHRHYRCDIWLYVQQWDALDVKIRNITNEVIWIQKGIFGTSIAKRVGYCLYFQSDGQADGIKKPGKILMGYVSPGVLGGDRFLRRKYYHYFDSYIRQALPEVPAGAF